MRFLGFELSKKTIKNELFGTIIFAKENKYFSWFFVSAILSWFLFQFRELRTPILVSLVTSSIFIVFEEKNKKSISFAYRIFYSLTLVLLFVISISIDLNNQIVFENTVYVFVIFILSFLMIVSSSGMLQKGKNKKLRIFSLVVYYTGFSIAAIIFFAFTMILFPLQSNNQPQDLINYTYFSSQIYFPNSVWDPPPNISPLLVTIESWFSSVLHIIFLGYVISGIIDENHSEDCKKKNSQRVES